MHVQPHSMAEMEFQEKHFRIIYHNVFPGKMPRGTDSTNGEEINFMIFSKSFSHPVIRTQAGTGVPQDLVQTPLPCDLSKRKLSGLQFPHL